MGSDQSFSRIDTLEIKTLIYRKIGHQRAENYFDHLRRYLTLRVSKSEFDKFCTRTLGGENIPLHNRLIRSIIKNASVAKSPPQNLMKVGNGIKFGNGYQKNHVAIYADPSFPPSPRRCRSKKFRDRPSPLGPLGKPQSLTTTTNIEGMSKAQSATEMLSLGSRPHLEVASVEDGEEVEQMAGSPSVQSRSPVTAPLGISINVRSGARKSISNVSICSNNVSRETCQNTGELPDTRALWSRLEKKLEMEGLRVSMDCANLLNNGLDAFLKRLIEPSLCLAGARCGNELWRETNSQLIGSGGRYLHKPSRLSHVSMSDFRAAIELNSQILGEEWPIHLEKICSRASEE